MPSKIPQNPMTDLFAVPDEARSLEQQVDSTRQQLFGTSMFLPDAALSKNQRSFLRRYESVQRYSRVPTQKVTQVADIEDLEAATVRTREWTHTYIAFNEAILPDMARLAKPVAKPVDTASPEYLYQNLAAEVWTSRRSQ